MLIIYYLSFPYITNILHYKSEYYKYVAAKRYIHVLMQYIINILHYYINILQLCFYSSPIMLYLLQLLNGCVVSGCSILRKCSGAAIVC